MYCRAILLAVAVLFLSATEALIHHLSIRNDHRSIFKIESFGFLKGGSMQLDVSNFNVKAPKHSGKLTGKEKDKLAEEITSHRHRQLAAQEQSVTATSTPSSPANVRYHVGFILRHASSESAAEQDLERVMSRKECIFDKRRENDLFIDLSDPADWPALSFVHEIDEDDEIGFYSLIFAHCNPKRASAANVSEEEAPGKLVSSSHYAKSFKLDVVFRNPGPNYLSAGDAPLPGLYFAFFALFSAAVAAWVFVLQGGRRKRSAAPSPAPVAQPIHYLMLALVSVKALTLLFESIRFHYIARFGASEVWSIVYYFFATLKGIMLFTVILLIGSGYSLMKGYLSANEKKVIFAVLVLQVLDNIAVIMLEETAPGSLTWLTWKDVLHLVDVLCCIAILVPIIWSIRHLKQAAEVSGKAHHNLMKLQLFRRFYIIVVLYIYFTRIAVFLIGATMPFYLEWLGPLLSELATLIFYVHTGYQFRPAANNPYLAVSSEDAEGEEYGLDDDAFDGSMEIELAAPVPSRKRAP